MDIAAAVQTIENGLEVGVLVSDSTGLKVQPLEFSGTSATANGAAVIGIFMHVLQGFGFMIMS